MGTDVPKFFSLEGLLYTMVWFFVRRGKKKFFPRERKIWQLILSFKDGKRVRR